MQVCLVNKDLVSLYTGKKVAVHSFECSSKDFIEVIETLHSLECVSDCSSFKSLDYKPPMNGQKIHSVQLNRHSRLLFEQIQEDEINIIGIQ